jgi:hypothetical protein
MLVVRSILAVAVLSATVGSLAAQTVSFGGYTLRTNKSASTLAHAQLVGPALQMNNTEFGAARSVLSTSTVNLSGVWSTTYRLSFDCGNLLLPDTCLGDGIGFVAAGGADTQLGEGGFDMGYGGSFTNSVTFGMKTFWNTADFGVDGSWDTPCCALPPLKSGADFRGTYDVALSYNGTNQLSASIFEVGSATTLFSGTRAWVAPAWASAARVGFTSGSGDWSENAYVEDWTLRPTTVVPEPSTYALLATGLAALVGIIARRRAQTRRG